VVSGGGTEGWLERVRRAPSPLLRVQSAAARIDPAALTLDDLPRLPRISPEDLDLDRLDDPVGHVRLADAAAPNRLGVSARGEQSVVVSWTAADLARLAADGARALGAAGIRRGNRVANTLEGGLTVPGSLALGDALEALGALDVPLGPASDEKSGEALAALIDRIGIEVLVVDAPSASALLPILAARRRPGVQGIVWTGAREPEWPERLPAWRRRWLSLPEVHVHAAVGCTAGALHVEPTVRVDAVDDVLYWSALAGDAPIWRYDVGLVGALGRERCSCGDSRRTIDVN
jgi:hypothetical protein